MRSAIGYLSAVFIAFAIVVGCTMVLLWVHCGWECAP